MTLQEWLFDYYAPLNNSSTRTLDLYLGTIRCFTAYLEHEATLDDLTDITVARFLQHRLQRDKVTPATAAKDRAQLSAMWSLAAKKRLVSDFPTVPKIRVPERVPQAWTVEQMQSIMQVIDGMRGDVGRYAARLWWRGLLLTLWDTGERISAVMTVPIANVDLHRRMILIQAETRKFQLRDMIFALGVDTIAAILPLIEDAPQDRHVFEWTTWPTHIYWHYKKILKAAGLPTDRRSKFHRIRRSVATYYKIAGGDATRLLDHSSPEITKKYIDPAIDRQVYPCDVLPGIAPHARPRGASPQTGPQL